MAANAVWADSYKVLSFDDAKNSFRICDDSDASRLLEKLREVKSREKRAFEQSKA